jgi:hypothetical protein
VNLRTFLSIAPTLRKKGWPPLWRLVVADLPPANHLRPAGRQPLRKFPERASILRKCCRPRSSRLSVADLPLANRLRPAGEKLAQILRTGAKLAQNYRQPTCRRRTGDDRPARNLRTFLANGAYFAQNPPAAYVLRRCRRPAAGKRPTTGHKQLQSLDYKFMFTTVTKGLSNAVYIIMIRLLLSYIKIYPPLSSWMAKASEGGCLRRHRPKP